MKYLKKFNEGLFDVITNEDSKFYEYVLEKINECFFEFLDNEWRWYGVDGDSGDISSHYRPYFKCSLRKEIPKTHEWVKELIHVSGSIDKYGNMNMSDLTTEGKNTEELEDFIVAIKRIREATNIELHFLYKKVVRGYDNAYMEILIEGVSKEDLHIKEKLKKYTEFINESLLGHDYDDEFGLKLSRNRNRLQDFIETLITEIFDEYDIVEYDEESGKPRPHISYWEVLYRYMGTSGNREDISGISIEIENISKEKYNDIRNDINSISEMLKNRTGIEFYLSSTGLNDAIYIKLVTDDWV